MEGSLRPFGRRAYGRLGPDGGRDAPPLSRASDARLGEKLGDGATRLFYQLSAAIRRASDCAASAAPGG
eukprot:8515053-Pyramimonas_sp.AAC.1